MSRNISKIRWTIAGLAAERSMRAVNSTVWRSCAKLGANSSTIPSALSPQNGAISSVAASRRASAGEAHG